MMHHIKRIIADEITKIMRLKDTRKIYRPMLHGVGWLGDVKRIALKIEKIKRIGFKPKISSRNAIIATTANIVKEVGSF
jgi:UDP-glucose 4-epimerase